MAPKRDLTNQQFGYLKVLEDTGLRNINGQVKWKCLCKCGNTVFVDMGSLTRGPTVSCGCYNREIHTTHGYFVVDIPKASYGIYKRTYNSWRNMKARCLNPRSISYFYYGAKGVTICKRWTRSFKAFLKDMGIRPENKTLDRIDNNKGYKPSNCRWADIYEQNQNREICKNGKAKNK